MGVGAGGHQRSVLLTLGRLPVSLELARAFASEGFRVVVVDSMQWHLCRASNAVSQCIKVPSPKKAPRAYEQALLSIIKEQEIDWVMPVSEEAAYVTKLKNQLPDNVQLMSVDHELWLGLHDKYTGLSLCKRSGLAVPETQLLTERLALETHASEALVIKKRFTAAGMGLQFVQSGAPIPQLSQPDDWVVQPKLQGNELCVFSVFNHGTCTLNTAYRALLVDGTVSVAFEYCEPPASLVSWLQGFGEATGYHGMASFDFMQNEHGEWCALECNPRATSGLHFTCGVQVMQALLEGTLQSREKPTAQHLMEFWSCFTLAFSSRSRRSIQYDGAVGLKALFRCLRSCKDISWSPSDRLPFLLMPLLSAPLLWLSVRHKQSFATSAVADISWPPHARDHDDG